MTCDFLVIGAGIAGLSFAIRAAAHGSVIVLTKGTALDSNTAWAQGGIASVLPPGFRDDGDSVELHVADTLDAGAGLCREDVVRAVIGEGAATIDDLTGYGVDFDKHDDHFALGKEGGHSKRRILHARDTTGREIAESMVEVARRTPNLTLLEDHFTIDLITTGKLGATTEDRVLGAYVLEKASGEVKIFRSDRVLLATGGCGKVYLYTTNPDSATGDGVAMAWRAGASVANMEFIQFHPTCLYHPDIKSFLISEVVRGEGGILINERGQRFMEHHNPQKELAPRDIVARAIDAEMKRSGAKCVYLDITHKPADFIISRFPTIYETCLRYGLDITKKPIPVVPAAHYQCGGVKVDINGETSLRGLFAIGEVACNGLHGANRLASNSLLEGVVTAHRAFEKSTRQRRERLAFDLPEWLSGEVQDVDELVVISHNWEEIRRLMWDYVGIVRTDKRLQRAATRLRNLHAEVQEFYWNFKVSTDLLELRNLVTVASLVVDCALSRKESRGLHYTLDYLERDDVRFLHDTITRRN